MRVLTQEEMAFVGGGDGCHPNNGWGNGDQNAPGNSLLHNNAENDKDHRIHDGTMANPSPGLDGCGGLG